MARAKADIASLVGALFEAHDVEECDAAADPPDARKAIKRAGKVATPDYVKALAAISYDDVPLWSGAWILLGLGLDKPNKTGAWVKTTALGIARSKAGKGAVFLDGSGELGNPGAYYVTAKDGPHTLGGQRVQLVAADTEALLRLLASPALPSALQSAR
jgi:hypothetical protein